MWGLELVSYGRSGAERNVGSMAPAQNHCGQRVEYDWDAALTEWYVNDRRGLEHGYTVHQRPNPIRAGSASARPNDVPTLNPSLALRARIAVPAVGEARVPHLQFTLAVRGDLRPRVSGDGRNVAFVNENGATVVNYNVLTVFDAAGAAAPAWFEAVEGSDGRDARTTQEAQLARVVYSAKYLRLVVDDSAAVYPLTIDPIAQQAYLKASNAEASDNFGSSVAVSGDTVVIGAMQEDSIATGVDGNQADNSATNSGAAYVFVRSDGVWSQQAYLKASNTDAGDNFGISVAVSGDTIVVAAHQEDSNATGVNGNQADNSAQSTGAVYVFVRSGNVWSQQAYLKASNTAANDNFGLSVAVSGDTVVVGANGEDNIASNSGATYVFTGAGPPCCPGDMNGDKLVDALDIQPFVEKLLSGGVCP